MAGPWYLERDGYEPFLRHTSLSESEYLDAINQLLALIPADEARAYGNQIMHAEGGLAAPFQLLPVPFTVLTKHPLKLFLSGYVPNYWILCEAVNLGRDLVETQAIPGTVSIRNDLRALDQYVGRLFEIELLAELQRASLEPVVAGTPDFLATVRDVRIAIEAKHRGAPFGAAVISNLTTALAFLDFGDLSVVLKAPGSSGETVQQVVQAIEADVRSVLSDASGARIPIERPTYSICHDHSAGQKVLNVRYGRSDYEEDLRFLIRSVLREKEQQLGRSSYAETQGLVAIDCRSLFPALPSQEKQNAVAPGCLNYYGPRIKRWESGLIGEAKQFVLQSSQVRGVLLWLRNHRAGRPCTIGDYYLARYSASLVTRDTVCTACSAGQLRDSLLGALA